MQLVVPQNHVKLFAKTINCLASIGEDLFIEATDEKVIFRTLNASRSCFVVFNMDQHFFQEYVVGEDQPKKYQVKLKACQIVFKQQTANMDQITISADENDTRLTFEFSCKHGIKKVFRLSFDEGDALQAVYSKESCENRLIISPKRLQDALNNFHGSLEEVTLLLTRDSCAVKSFTDDIKSASKMLQTELRIPANDFEEYEIDNECGVTFCLKDFRNLLRFCTQTDNLCTIFVERGGRPILLSLKYMGVFEADFVLATLVDNTQVSPAPSQSATPASPASNMSATINGSLRKPGPGPRHALSYPKASPTSLNPQLNPASDFQTYSPNSSQQSGTVSASDPASNNHTRSVPDSHRTSLSSNEIVYATNDDSASSNNPIHDNNNNNNNNPVRHNDNDNQSVLDQVMQYVRPKLEGNPADAFDNESHIVSPSPPIKKYKTELNGPAQPDDDEDIPPSWPNSEDDE